MLPALACLAISALAPRVRAEASHEETASPEVVADAVSDPGEAGTERLALAPPDAAVRLPRRGGTVALYVVSGFFFANGGALIGVGLGLCVHGCRSPTPFVLSGVASVGIGSGLLANAIMRTIDRRAGLQARPQVPAIGFDVDVGRGGFVPRLTLTF